MNIIRCDKCGKEYATQHWFDVQNSAEITFMQKGERYDGDVYHLCQKCAADLINWILFDIVPKEKKGEE